VVIPDFRLSPEFGFPAQLEDCESTYEWLRKDQKAKKVAIAGDSSGGNLAAALTLKEKDTPPEAVALLSPFLDMTISGETYDLNSATDHLVSKTNATRAAEMYVAGKFDPIPTNELKEKVQNPLVSPLLADNLPEVFKSTKLLIHASLSEALLCDSVNFYEKVSGDTLPPLSELVKKQEYSRHEKDGRVLELFPNQPHAFEAYVPKKHQSEFAVQSVARFLDNSLSDKDTTEQSIYRTGFGTNGDRDDTSSLSAC